MIEPGSFRDPDSRVFYQGDRVLRALGGRAAAADSAARSVGLFKRLESRGVFVESWVVTDANPPPGVYCEAVVESRRLPIVSYPSEWSFDMLRAAALVTLEANLIALESGFILKDASAFNVLFEGATPRIVDVSSIEPFGDSGIWTAYGQFCDHFLAPLMLNAYVGVPHHGVIRGQTGGLPIGDLNRLLRGRSGFHKGVVKHVRLRSVLERFAERMDTESRTQVAKSSLPRQTVAASIAKTMKLVAGLEASAPTVWADYQDNAPYDADSFEAKARFVSEAAGNASRHGLALDVGANVGRFTGALIAHFDCVVGIDTDAGAVDALFRTVRDQQLERLTPLVVDITNPTPSFGWRGRERSSFMDRVRPSFATWLAVIHHICLGLGIPLDELVALVADVSEQAVVEFVAPEDPMARRISASRRASLGPYSRHHFEESAARHGSIRAKLELSETRTLYHLARH